ncbi:MAG: terpene cyclase/mutase family protein [Planctomycetes bacterium]|nr:terpene cyclase/mutase family protein [Planctomycetota bacterium]
MDSKEPVDANFPGRTFGQAVQRGLTWLITHQDPEGCLGERGMKYVYNHAIAALALTEAYLMTGAADLKEAADKAVQFTIAAQNPGKGWRYSARCGDNDTSVTGWGALGLKAGELAGFDVPRKSFDGAVAWLSEAAEEKFGFITGYNARGTGKVYVPGKNEQFDHHPTMTAIGIFLRAMITKRRSDPPFIGVETVLEDPPAWRTNVIDFYYWHWASLAVHQVEPYGPKWKKWYDAVKKALLEGQRPATEACRRGSWDPEMERWGGEGGRVYATAIGALVLETPYRYPVFVTDTKSLPKKK